MRNLLISLVLLGLLGGLLATVLACGNEEETESRTNATVVFKDEFSRRLHRDYSKNYEFSDDWFTKNIPVWRRLLAEYVGAPNLHYLEIGVYEGRASIWMLENVLTHETSRLTALDIFTSEQIRRRWLDNVEKSGRANSVTTIKGYSQITLRDLPVNSYDIIYIDGSHTADDVLADAIQSWALLKVGGTLIFDDYTWDGSYFAGNGSHLPEVLLPRLAVNAFVNTHRSYLNVVYSGLQLVVKRRDNPCPNKSYCTPIGSYTYDWQSKTLARGSDGGVVRLSVPDRRRLEQILWDRNLHRRFISATPMVEEPEIRELLDRLEENP
jgi:predicted O-methyltransferase YrrM